MNPEFDWSAVESRDFYAGLDEPGRRSGAALAALLADLGLEDDPSDEWGERMHASLNAGLPALLERLSHPDVAVRRILAVVLTYVHAEAVAPALRARSEIEPDAPTRLGLLVALGPYADVPETRDHLRRHLGLDPSDALGAAIALLLAGESDDEVLDALALCGGEAGAALAELAWADPQWDGPVQAVNDWLSKAPDPHYRWLTRMWAGHLAPSTARTLVEAVNQLFKHGRPDHDLGQAVSALLKHPDPTMRRVAAKAPDLVRHEGYADALGEALDDPEVSELALTALTRHGHPHCVPAMRHLIRHGPLSPQTLYPGVSVLAAQLWPDVRARLAGSPSAAETLALLSWVGDWAGGETAVPEVTTTLERLIPQVNALDAAKAAANACQFLRRWGLTDDRALAVLRQTASGPDLKTALAAIRALMSLGEPSDPEIIGLLLNILARRHDPGPKTGASNACAWLGELGPRALSAAPALRAVRDNTTEPDKLRTDAAFALWRIIHDAQEALPLLAEQIPNNPAKLLHDISLMGSAAQPAIPLLRAYAEGEGPAAGHARKALFRITQKAEAPPRRPSL